MSNPTANLMTAVYEVQPEKIVKAIQDGANPYNLVETPEGPDKPKQSAIGMVISSSLIGQVLGGRSDLSKTLKESIDTMLAVKLQSTEQGQEIINTCLKVMENEQRAIFRYQTTEDAARDLSGQLSSEGWESLRTERRGANVLLWAVLDSQSAKEAIGNIQGPSANAYHEARMQSMEAGRKLGIEDAKFKRFERVNNSQGGYYFEIQAAMGETDQLKKQNDVAPPKMEFNTDFKDISKPTKVDLAGFKPLQQNEKIDQKSTKPSL